MPIPRAGRAPQLSLGTGALAPDEAQHAGLAGAVVGLVAAAKTSGLGDWTHLHFEIRTSDYDSANKDYGNPINPLRLLPVWWWMRKVSPFPV